MAGFRELFRKLPNFLDKGIDPDESVLFYPSIATRLSTGGFGVEVRGRIFEKFKAEEVLERITLALAGVPNKAALEERMRRVGDEADFQAIFTDRIRDFLFDDETGEEFEVAFGETRVKCDRSDGGLFGLDRPGHSLPASPSLKPDRGGWIQYTAIGKLGRSFSGRSLLPDRGGVIVVSDIDDTIKDSNVPDKVELTLNTLFRPFKATPRLPRVYQDWQNKNAKFIYLSNSPYQLFRPLMAFLQSEAVGYPHGAYYMRNIKPSDILHEISNLVAPSEKAVQENAKKHNLIPILEAFPDCRFLLVGDSTEFDAEIYTDLYLGRNFPEKFSHLQKSYADRIKGIYIRDVKNSDRRRSDIVETLRPIPDSDVALFKDEETPAVVEKAATVFRQS